MKKLGIYTTKGKGKQMLIDMDTNTLLAIGVVEINKKLTELDGFYILRILENL